MTLKRRKKEKKKKKNRAAEIHAFRLKSSQIWSWEWCWLSYFSVGLSPRVLLTGQLLSLGGNDQELCVCVSARARVLFLAHAHPLGSLKVGNTLSIPGPPPSGLVPASQGLEEGVPSPGRASCDQVQCSARSVLKQGPASGSWAPRRWTPSSHQWAARTRPGPPRARAPPVGAQSPGEEEQGGARHSPGQRTVTEFDTPSGSWSLARTPDPSQMETVSPSEPAGILSGISLRLCLLAHLSKAAFTTLRPGRFQMERGSWLQNKVSWRLR